MGQDQQLERLESRKIIGEGSESLGCDTGGGSGQIAEPNEFQLAHHPWQVSYERNAFKCLEKVIVR